MPIYFIFYVGVEFFKGGIFEGGIIPGVEFFKGGIYGVEFSGVDFSMVKFS